ncbi:response regulator receiver-modulated CheB methylesterase [Limnobacter thiooxidans]|uniref:Protein-glutamate methylesterase/protein-glutamine glutaminase n=1 Tax=Limnobacter thiooxidans TaxID=131080 RepID=A0AA86M8B2_9BURK|nr:chemotaxis response regulator protein-glutamate methylesterase [Limnobacter sp.]MCZ8015907.1 chemotaxis response regulator protein-glutamate methylesterase [Limnobacter sp.]RZS42988.1 response regulator receiver-modulated CheB methylesterase [Limnobacter thiooxidans]BET25574.1 chemotaxis response regulator protein-glutamate methylesterase [Limnobacter thiooxidans]
MNKIKVLVVDDSALIRNLMSKIINSQQDMETIATAPDPFIARDQIKKFNPDVITLDIEMPKMDGIEFLEKIMRLRPTPVLMVSTLTERGTDVTFRALELGAVDFVTKPKLDISQGMIDYANEITDKIRAAHAARYRLNRLPAKPPAGTASSQVDPVTGLVVPAQAGKALPVNNALGNRFAATEKLVLIGSSTGGTEALRVILEQLPKDSPAILITQHMPAGFTKSFADRLNQVCDITVKEATHGERILPGHAYIAPGDKHLMLGRNGANYICQLSDSEPVNRHRPSVEVLFKSGQEVSPRNIVGIMLTGMGKDGAQAMADMKKAGAYNICQDEASSVVFGMPREAIALGAADEVVSLNQIAKRLLEHLSKIGGRSAVRI